MKYQVSVYMGGVMLESVQFTTERRALLYINEMSEKGYMVKFIDIK